MADTDLCALSASEQVHLVRTGQVTPVDLVDAALDRIDLVQPICNPFAFVFAEEARAEAAAAAEKVAGGGELGPLHGLPVAFKDFTPTKGHRTTRGSVAFEHWIPDHDPVIVQRFKAAGAIIVGKTTTPEFAYSSFTRSELFGNTGNPWAPERSSGGSSGGAGVAATTGCVAFAEGTDMGGSVRIPAALCGCVGLKPSLGRIPMDILPTSFDDMSHFGPLARTVEDAALFLRVAEGPDETDIMSQRVPVPLPAHFDHDLTGLTLAVSEDLDYYAVDAEVLVNFHAAARALEEAGATLVPVKLGWGPDLNDAWYAWWGVYQAAAFADTLPRHRDRMDPAIVTLIEDGLKMNAVDFAQIDQVRTRQWHQLATVFHDHHALLCPTMALPAPDNNTPDGAFGHVGTDGRYHGLDMTEVFNLVGHCPALSVPSGRTASGLPTGLQIVGRRFDDPTVLRIGATLEMVRPWTQWTPDAFA
ncbi:MAG: amidase [Pseudomonadota bacterium]